MFFIEGGSRKENTGELYFFELFSLWFGMLGNLT